MTQAQLIREARKLADKLSSIQSDIEYLKDEAESAREEYEDKDELTDRQQEKYYWLDEFASTLEEVIDNVSEAVDSLDTED